MSRKEAALRAWAERQDRMLRCTGALPGGGGMHYHVSGELVDRKTFLEFLIQMKRARMSKDPAYGSD